MDIKDVKVEIKKHDKLLDENQSKILVIEKDNEMLKKHREILRNHHDKLRGKYE